MANIQRAGQRAGAMSFGGGMLYGATPTTGQIVIDSTAARSDDGGIHVSALSLTAVSLTLPTLNNASAVLKFERFYFKMPSSRPSFTRTIWCQAATTTSRVNLSIRSDGILSLNYAGSGVAISSTALVAGRWYCLEVAIDSAKNNVALRVDGSLEVDWTAAGATVSMVSTTTFGCLDTSSGAFEYYIDDLAWDSLDWVGAGKVKLVKILDLITDSASWVLTGTTKVAAMDPNPSGSGFDDTTFITCSTLNADITFGLNSLPSNAVAVYSITPWTRAIRTGASNSILVERVGWRGGGTPESISISSAQASTTSAFQVQQMVNGAWSSVFGGFFPTEFQDQLLYGLRAGSANAQKVTAFWVEVEYSDIAGDLPFERPLQLADWEESTLAEFIATNRSSTGTVNQTSSWSKFGASALELVHASGGSSRIRFQLEDNQSLVPFIKLLYASGWVYCTARPSGGTVQIMGVTDAGTLRWSLLMDSTGALIASIDGSLSSAAGSIPLNTETHISIEFLGGTIGASNTRMRVWVNEVLVITFSHSSVYADMDSSMIFQVGANANVTGGATVRYDGWIWDGSTRHDRSTKVQTAKVSGAGSTTAGGFTASSGTKPNAVDEVPDNGDTDYVLLATGLGTTTTETYNIDNPSTTPLRVLQLIQVVVVTKRDAATNGSYSSVTAVTLNGITSTVNGPSAASTSAYAALVNMVRSLAPFGRFTAAFLTALESGVRQGSNTVATRVTSIQTVYAYKPSNQYPQKGSNKVVVVG